MGLGTTATGFGLSGSPQPENTTAMAQSRNESRDVISNRRTGRLLGHGNTDCVTGFADLFSVHNRARGVLEVAFAG